MMPGSTNLIFAGVGGQGSILATQIVAAAASIAGHRVVTSEVHGMAQRGGSVMTTVRFGPHPLTPDVPPGEADFLIAFERLEMLRMLPLLRPTGIVVLNDQRIAPSLESLKTAEYPTNAVNLAQPRVAAVHVVPALEIANTLGNPRLASAALLGALSTLMDFPVDAWAAAVSELVPDRTRDANLEAFERGAAYMLATFVGP